MGRANDARGGIAVAEIPNDVIGAIDGRRQVVEENLRRGAAYIPAGLDNDEGWYRVPVDHFCGVVAAIVFVVHTQVHRVIAGDWVQETRVFEVGSAVGYAEIP